MGEQEDRRAYARHDCDMALEGQFGKGAKETAVTFKCRATNASEGGMMLRTQRELTVGEQLELFLQDEQNVRSVVAEAEVMWSEPDGDGYRSGVRFLSRREDFAV